MCNILFAIALSNHIGLSNEYNEVHPAVKCDVTETGLIAGVYYNSESNVSVYGGIKLKDKQSPLWLEIGAVTGYSGHDVLPFIRAGVDIKKKVSLFVAPAIEGDIVGAVAGLELRF